MATDKNTKTLLATLGVVVGMVVISFASVPLYKKLCQVTGWGGTTRVVAENPHKGAQHEREMVVRFNADIDPALPWHFKPKQNAVKVRVGEDGFVSYAAENKTAQRLSGTAIYNVTPLEAGKYFYKTQCFCFGEMVLQARQKADLPIVFFIDPKISEDRNLDDVKTITLSYTFYPQDTPQLEKAVENFINAPDTSVENNKG
ncbi:MAG: cytochrome c oxidase assembly protein [Alphaproteobacteria bacterium]|nr:cytochrome c oxidase assembly protein [Alphaproteobacteria bacterium]